MKLKKIMTANGGFCVLFSLLFISYGADVSAKILEIIIGGRNKGIECRQDEDCEADQFCHTEQKFCIACQTPPYQWTGTECRCPAGTVDKDGVDCVQCLTDIDCAQGDSFCHTTDYTCHVCKAPKLWQNNTCLCPPDTHESDDTCACDNPHKILDEYGLCQCPLTPDSCPHTDLNLQECLCCPLDTPLIQGNRCITCTDIHPDHPLWNAALKQCVQCLTPTDCPTDKPVCSGSGICQACPPGTPYWNGTQCVECTQHNQCPDNQYCQNASCTWCPSNQIRSSADAQCHCPGGLPYWNGTQCVECTQNDQCGGNNICTNNQCVPFTCQNAGFAHSGLRITQFDPSRDMWGNPYLGGIWDKGSSMGSSRKDCNYGRMYAEGVLYAARSGTYQFRVMGGDWGESEVKLWMDNGKLVYSAQKQNPGIASIWLSEGVHTFTYDGWMTCRRNMTFDYDQTWVKACTNQ